MASLHSSPLATGPTFSKARPALAPRCSLKVVASTRRSGAAPSPTLASRRGSDAAAEAQRGDSGAALTLPARTLMLASAAALLLSAPAPALARMELPNKEVDDATSPLVQKLLQRTAENKERYAKERLQDYYRRNFREYFEFEGSSAKVAKARGLSPESAAAIQKWLQENK